MNKLYDVPSGVGKKVIQDVHKSHIVPTIKICTYNIIHGGNSRLALALKALNDMNVDIGILTETKLKENTYTRKGY